MTTMNAIRWRAHRDIDEAAGETRQRYITDVAGQEATYIVKLQQAEAYLATLQSNPEATAPPYVMAEMRATGRQSLIDGAFIAAQEIVATGYAWNNVLGPQIEEVRRAGKIAVNTAATEAEVWAARDEAIAALSLI